MNIRLPHVFASLGALSLVGAASIAVAQMAPTVSGASATHIAVMSGQNEVPPVTTNGEGMALFRFDPQTNQLNWTVEYAGLTGPVTGAHIHGPAGAEENAPVLIDLGAAGLASPIVGQTTITTEQANQLANGQWYVNVHTEGNPGGEIRGQVTTNM